MTVGVLFGPSAHKTNPDDKGQTMTIRDREDTRPAWHKIAPGYDRHVTPTHTWLGNEGLRRVGLRAGMRFVDVAAGSGALSIPAARLGARVLATDHCARMLELLQARALHEGLDIQTRVMDGHHLELDDDSFDIAGSQFGVMLFEHMPLGLREMSRVVKPGGKVLVSAYGNPRKIEFFGLFVGALQSVRPGFDGPPADPPPLPFQLQDPHRLQRELVDAGLHDIKVETIVETTEYADADALWQWIVWSNPIVETVLGHLELTRDELDTVRQVFATMAQERVGGGGQVRVTAPINIGVGTK